MVVEEADGRASEGLCVRVGCWRGGDRWQRVNGVCHVACGGSEVVSAEGTGVTCGDRVQSPVQAAPRRAS